LHVWYAVFQVLKSKLLSVEAFKPQLAPREVGTITSIATGIDEELFDVISSFESLGEGSDRH